MSETRLFAAWRGWLKGLGWEWGRLSGSANAFLARRREADIALMQRRYGLTREDAVRAAMCRRERDDRENRDMDDWRDERSILGM